MLTSTRATLASATLTLTVTLPLAGLGFDVATLYLVKSKLITAVDAAALAGARALSQGANGAAQAANATSAVTLLFNANYPGGYWQTSGVTESYDQISRTDYFAEAPKQRS